MPTPTIVFDLDGTLVDTAPDLIETLNLILARQGVPPATYDVARASISGGARLMIERSLLACQRAPTPELVNRMFEEFIDHYESHIAIHSQLFPQVESTLDDLLTRGCRLAVCTNKLERLSVRLLDTFKLTSRFSAICGRDTFGIQKPDPLILHKAIAASGGQLTSAVMVGDSNIDILTAKAAHVPIVAVEFGYSDRHVSLFAPDHVVAKFDELIGAFNAIGVFQG
jgi:phosphoglycolate phosphatase